MQGKKSSTVHPSIPSVSSAIRALRREAFTLVEVVLGMAILSVVMMAITGLAVTSLRANQANIHRLTAYYLAQESLEGLRNLRDSNWLQNITWNQSAPIPDGAGYWGIPEGFNIDGYYTIDYVPWSSDIESESAPWVLHFLGSDPSVLEDDAGALAIATSLEGEVFYLHDRSWNSFTYADAGYRRLLTVSYAPDDEDWVEVTATVFWVDYGKERFVEVSTILSDWREGPI